MPDAENSTEENVVDVLPPFAPAWVIVRTKSLCEEVVERSLRQAGYRSYLPRYRKLLAAHGIKRRPIASMRPLFPGLCFAQDWRGWPDTSISGAVGLMQGRPGVARLCDADVALIMSRERAGDFDDIRHPRGSGKYIRDDIKPGDEVEIAAFGRRVLGVLAALTPTGKAIISAMIFDRLVRVEVNAEAVNKAFGTI